MEIENEGDLDLQLARRHSERALHSQYLPIAHKKVKKTESVKAFYIIEHKIYLFTEMGNSEEIIMKLNNIAVPISRPAHINEFEVTENSLLRAKALGLGFRQVEDFLVQHMKNQSLQPSLVGLLRKTLDESVCPRLFLSEGKDRNSYLLEIPEGDFNVNPSLLPIIEQFSESVEVVAKTHPQDSHSATDHGELPLKGIESHEEKIRRYTIKPYQHNQLAEKMFQHEIALSTEKLIEKNMHKQEKQTKVQYIKNEEALHCKDLKISLKAFTKLRDYQSQALRSCVKSANGELTAKSGYIVLPCGAGKTLLGISICAKIKKETLIVCSSDSGADQWKREIEKWTQGVHRDSIIILTAKAMSDFKFNVNDTKSHIYISTYSNLKSKFEPKKLSAKKGDGKTGAEKEEMKSENVWLRRMPWGLVVFDEAQWLPAEGNREIVNSLMAHVKVGLTATPLREDDSIKALIYMLGPQLYEGSWKKFVENGFLANPKCLEVRTSMTPTFEKLYSEQAGRGGGNEEKMTKQTLYEANPNKVRALVYLLEHHERLNDQIIVFCDSKSLIKFLAERLCRPLLDGDTDNEDRNFVFDMFREGKFKTVFLSRIGDEAIDLPNANVAIEVAMHKGSRRQMMQRLGRIMRPKQASSSESYNAVFYTIVSEHTLEMKYFQKRREYLVNLGFQYDLRLFEYGHHDTNMHDIYRNDPEGRKLVEARMQTVIPDEYHYYQALKASSGKDNHRL